MPWPNDLLRATCSVRLARELVERVELARDLREVVVGLGKLALLDGGDGDGDLGGLALVVAAEELRLEGGRLAGGERVEGLVDALEQLARAELVRDAAGGVDLGVVDDGDEVEGHEVAGLGGAVDRDERAEAAAEALELLGDLLVADLDGVDRELEAVVVGQLDLGAHVDLDREEQVAGEVLLVRPLDDVGLGAAEGAQLVLGHRGAVEPVEALVDRVLEHGGLADPLVDDGRRHLALAEARHVDLLGDVLVGVGDAGLQLLGRHRDGELGARGAQLLNRSGRHGEDLLLCGSSCRVVQLVGATGFEPATSRSQSGRSTKLSYAPSRRLNSSIHPHGHAEACGSTDGPTKVYCTGRGPAVRPLADPSAGPRTGAVDGPTTGGRARGRVCA